MMHPEERTACECYPHKRTADIVVSDVILPRIGGLELLRRIHEGSPDVRVILITGEPTVEYATEALRAGAVDFL